MNHQEARDLMTKTVGIMNEAANDLGEFMKGKNISGTRVRRASRETVKNLKDIRNFVNETRAMRRAAKAKAKAKKPYSDAE